MNKLEELLEETNFTRDEYETYRKVQKHYQLYDMEDLLDEMWKFGKITKKEYETALSKADIIIYKYDKWLDYEWRQTMKDAIDYVLKVN